MGVANIGHYFHWPVGQRELCLQNSTWQQVTEGKKNKTTVIYVAWYGR